MRLKFFTFVQIQVGHGFLGLYRDKGDPVALFKALQQAEATVAGSEQPGNLTHGEL